MHLHTHILHTRGTRFFETALYSSVKQYYSKVISFQEQHTNGWHLSRDMTNNSASMYHSYSVRQGSLVFVLSHMQFIFSPVVGFQILLSTSKVSILNSHIWRASVDHTRQKYNVRHSIKLIRHKCHNLILFVTTLAVQFKIWKPNVSTTIQ